ncbi:MAG: efflux RND transporter periplasmic adaptor subunit [Victivallaceae bacterium]|nr:efflux RND transporter periplasmic adaptor subunit [Victivallaceae bacterium]
MRRSYFLLPAAVLSALLTAALFLYGCGDDDHGKKRTTDDAAFTPAVKVSAVRRGESRNVQRLIARVKPFKSVRLTARVSGFITERCFKEGGFVKSGDTLFRIEADTYEIALEQARAELARLEAESENAGLEYNRTAKLYEEQVAAVKRFDDARAAQAAAAAAVLQARAAVRQAELNLGYTEIKAPFDGWIGLVEIDAGNYVQAPAGPLATLNCIDTVRVEFNLPDSMLTPEISGLIASGAKPPFSVRIELPDGGGPVGEYPVECWNNAIGVSTSTITMQAVADNPGHRMLPGAYATVAVSADKPESVLLLDAAALRRMQNMTFVYIVNSENKLELRAVEVGLEENGSVQVISGVAENERAVLAGNPRLRDGENVRIIQ